MKLCLPISSTFHFQGGYKYFLKIIDLENQDGGVGGHAAPPRAARADGESNSGGDQHQENGK